MKNYLIILLFVFAACKGNGQRDETDLTNSEQENISPDQVISEEEQQKKDSTNGDIIGRDTTRTKGNDGR